MKEEGKYRKKGREINKSIKITRQIRKKAE